MVRFNNIRLTQTECEAECEDCGARTTGMDSRDWAVSHVRETVHLIGIRILMVVAPEPTGWQAR
jgi:hypothetical protein